LVEGRLQLDTWEDKSGQKRSKHKVVVEGFQFMGAKEDRPAEDKPAIGQRAEPVKVPRAPEPPTEAEEPDDIPF